MHADDFRYDRYGVVSGLRDGGYSDDMTLAALAGNTVSSKSLSRLIRNSIFPLILKLQLCTLIDLQPFNCSYVVLSGAHKRLITSPPVAVFPHPLASDLSFSRFVTFTH